MIDKKDRKEFVKQILVIAATLFIIVNIAAYICSMTLHYTPAGIMHTKPFNNLYQTYMTIELYERPTVPYHTPFGSPLPYILIGLPLPYILVERSGTILLFFYVIPLIVDILTWVAAGAIIVWFLHQKSIQKQLKPLEKDIRFAKHLITDKHSLLGICLILYAMFLTPAYFEPSDLGISTGWIAFALAFFPSNLMWILPIWMWTGYVAVFAGAFLIGKKLLNRFGTIGREIEIHPWLAFGVISILSAIMVYIILTLTWG